MADSNIKRMNALRSKKLYHQNRKEAGLEREDDNPIINQGNVQKRNQDPPINPEIIDNYRLWMLAPSRFRHHQNSHHHVKDVGERYVKGKSNGPQRQPMKNQTSNGRVSHFDAIRSTSEEDVPKDE